MNDLSLVKKNYINYINKIVNNNKISHSYLIEIDDYETDFCYILDFIKMILCDVCYENLDSTNSIVSLIDSNNYPDLKIIQPDGNTIKKAQLLDLQKDFSNTSLLNSKRIYIIKEAEKLNVSSANTMLKFLEEPEDNIIAFLVTDNRYHVIDTLLSRCQILTLKENKIRYVEDDNLLDLLECVFKPQNFFIKYNYFLQNVVVDKNVAKDMFLEVQDIIITFLNNKYCDNNTISDDVYRILSKENDKCLLRAISTIEECVALLEYNVNYKLWLDSLFSKLIIGG